VSGPAGTALLVDATAGALDVQRTADCPAPMWESLLDAAAAALEVLAEDRVRIAPAQTAVVAWWFATGDALAAPVHFTERARRALAPAVASVDDLAATLAADPARRESWPLVLTGLDGATVQLDDEADLGMRRRLTAYQRTQVARLCRAQSSANFSVPGAGKTTVALCVLAARRRCGVSRALVVAPLSAHEAWETEPAECFEPGSVPRVAVNPERIDARTDIAVVHYERLQDPDMREYLERWLRAAPATVIFDEAHRAKRGRDGIRGAAALNLAAAARHRMVLSGTPAPNGPGDLARVLDLAFPGRGAALLRDPRRARTWVRATKSQVGLPQLQTRVERLPLSAAHERLYAAMLGQAQAALAADPALAADLRRIGRIVMLLLQAATDPAAILDPTTPLAMTGDDPDPTLVTLAQQAASSVVPAKFVRVAQIVDANAAAGHRTVVWSCFTHHIAALRRLLAKHAPAVITGTTPIKDDGAPTDRRRELHRFRTDPDCQVLIATPQTLGEGVSLHRTSTHQVHVDRTFNAGIYLQALDRTHRLGLPFGTLCTATTLIAEGTLDEGVEQRVGVKIAAMAALLDDPDLGDLTLPDTDDRLTDTELLLGPADRNDLLALFAHLRT
jgi:superfamily II DNA or RNA helicase